MSALPRDQWPRQTCDIPIDILPQIMAPAIYIRCRRDWGHVGKCSRSSDTPHMALLPEAG